MGKKLRKFWEDHHEAVITGAVTFVATAATGGIAVAYNSRKNSVQHFSIVSPETEDGETLLEMKYADGRTKYLPMPVEGMNITPVQAIQAAPDA